MSDIESNDVGDSNPYERPRQTGPHLSEGVPYRRIWPTLVWAVLLLFLAAQHILVAIGLAIVILPVQAILLLFTLIFRRHREHAVQLRAIRIGIYALTLVVGLGAAIAETRFIKAQAQELVRACEAFQRDHGRLPESLSELVPEYRPSVPNSLGRLSRAIYFYTPPDENSAARFFYRLTPDDFRSYSFETQAWTPP